MLTLVFALFLLDLTYAMKKLYCFLYFYVFICFSLQAIEMQKDSAENESKNLNLLGLVLPAKTPENGWLIQGGGIGYFRTDSQDSTLRNSNLYLFGLYSQLRQYRISIGGDVVFPNERFYLYSWIYSAHVPELFWRIGNSDFTDDGEFIEYNLAHAEADGLFQLKGRWYAGLTFDFETVYNLKWLRNIERLLEINPYSVVGCGPRIRFDSRNDVMWPSHGWYVDSYFKYLSYLNGADDFAKIFKLDFRKYSTLSDKRSIVLSTGAYLQTAGGNVPFRYYPANTTRAYHPNMLKNKIVETVVVDLRLRVYRFIHAAFFVEGCNSSNLFSKVKEDNLTYSVGPGLRFNLSKTDEVYLRLDYGIGRESSNFHLSFYNYF